MVIGLNCIKADPTTVGGINSYIRGLLDGFANTVVNGHRFRLYVAPGNQHFFEKYRSHKSFDVVVMQDPWFDLKKRICRGTLLSWSSNIYKVTSDAVFTNARKLIDAEADVVYTPTTVLQWFNGRKPTVITMHDIQQVRYPQFFSWPVRLSRGITYNLTARHATYFQAISEFCKREFLAYFRELSPEQIEVIPSGVNVASFAAPCESDLSDRLPERFLFAPANLWPHKNHLTILRALKQIEQKNGDKIPLVLTGAHGTAARQVFRFIADHSMHYVYHLGKVSAEDMVALYQKAAFLITATLYEATSLPILEAAASGTPVIASRIPPLEELASVLQLNLFDPLDVDALARLIYGLWNDEKPAATQAMVNRGRIANYSWDNTARKYVWFFERILNS